MASRTQVAAVLADQMGGKGRAGAVLAAAAWLVDTGRDDQADYLARDVAANLAASGYVLVHVITARPLTAGARAKVEAYVKELTGAHELELETSVDIALIGGVRIETPSAQLDGTIRAKLASFVEGVSR
jgi:F0F1-type ATP synthase delta subunit